MYVAFVFRGSIFCGKVSVLVVDGSPYLVKRFSTTFVLSLPSFSKIGRYLAFFFLHDLFFLTFSLSYLEGFFSLVLIILWVLNFLYHFLKCDSTLFVDFLFRF